MKWTRTLGLAVVAAGAVVFSGTAVASAAPALPAHLSPSYDRGYAYDRYDRNSTGSSGIASGSSSMASGVSGLAEGLAKILGSGSAAVR
ncbi:hypothetical protein [Nocardia arthritidis]|uniref:Uncharacterized protein n=1 Tax=Nocardia arthritidis TaxID=228602 RepID=A0A6G9YLD2_9NOCA|nr:hypothetical protein [Nocardia arthritidis]QIS14014.1 hypothetical protein F5544_30855 [Nocardia arthritidis]